MPESLNHMKFVNLLFFEAKKIIPIKSHSLIYLDKPEETYKPSRTSENFVPDLVYNYNKLLVIGEAKTANDVVRPHSILQYKSYYKDAVNFDGKAIILLSVPWYLKNTIKNTIRRIKRKYEKSIDVYVITELGKEQVIWAISIIFTN